jgi:hypothetical protein
LISGGHDSLLGYSGDMEFGLGYDFCHSLEVKAQVPIYWLSPYPRESPTGETTLANRYGSLGDVELKLEFAPDLDLFDYTATVTGTLPTGVTAVSAGRPSWEINNRLEREVWREFNPFTELIVGNVLPVATRLGQNSTTPGVEFQARAGNKFKIVKPLAFEAAFYEALPITGENTVATAAPLSLPVQLSDHGFVGSLLASRGRWDLDITYMRSISNRLGSIWATLGYRIGHMRKESE